MNRNTMYLAVKFTAVCSIAYMRFQADAEKGLVLLSALAFLCIFLLQYIVAKTEKNRNIFFVILSMAGCFFGNLEQQMPLFLILSAELIEYFSIGQMFYQLSIIIGVLLLLLFRPESGYLLVAVLLFVFTLLLRMQIQALLTLKEQNIKQKEQIQEMRKRVTDMNTYTKTLRQTTALEERKRFAARIHDQLGHGISGSILLLEGAKLQMDTNPELAGETIQRVAGNLREGVENIRMSLREERPERLQIGIGEIKEHLERFQIEYNISTKLVLEGEISHIPAEIWICAKENLTEALTNVLKHSNADAFVLKIQAFSKLIRLEYRDNGRTEEPFVKGMGTEGIEERTVLLGGKCLFSTGINGFCITNIFMKEGEDYGNQNPDSFSG